MCWEEEESGEKVEEEKQGGNESEEEKRQNRISLDSEANQMGFDSCPACMPVSTLPTMPDVSEACYPDYERDKSTTLAVRLLSEQFVGTHPS